MNKNISIPRWLQEFHGEKASLLSLTATYVAGSAVGLFVYLSAEGLEGWQMALGVGLALDIGGGVVANFSASTTRYYLTRPRFRWIFITLHLAHPLLLWILFDNQWILVIGATTLLFTGITNRVAAEDNQRVVAASLVLTNLLFIYYLFSNEVLLLLLTCYSLKLIVAFAVRWNDDVSLR